MGKRPQTDTVGCEAVRYPHTSTCCGMSYFMWTGTSGRRTVVPLDSLRGGKALSLKARIMSLREEMARNMSPELRKAFMDMSYSDIVERLRRMQERDGQDE
jgi:hypothetical protein